MYEKLFEWVPHVEDISPGVRQYTYAPRRPSQHRPMIVRVDSYNRQFVAIADVGNSLSLAVIAVTFGDKTAFASIQFAVGNDLFASLIDALESHIKIDGLPVPGQLTALRNEVKS